MKIQNFNEFINENLNDYPLPANETIGYDKGSTSKVIYKLSNGSYQRLYVTDWNDNEIEIPERNLKDFVYDFSKMNIKDFLHEYGAEYAWTCTWNKTANRWEGEERYC